MTCPDAPKLAELLRGFTYKPGWSFTLVESYFGGPRLVVKALVPHRDNPSLTITVTANLAVPYCLEDHFDRPMLMRWLHSQIMSVEEHEVDEWFTVDGVRVFDPHAAGPAMP